MNSILFQVFHIVYKPFIICKYVHVTGIVTRCPLVLRLKSSVNGDQEWRGRINYTDSEGHHHSKDIHSPQDVGDCVLQGKSALYMLPL